MKAFKILLRVLFKLIGTPFALSYYGLMLTVGYGNVFTDWLYDTDDFEKRITKITLNDFKNEFKKWFTTI